MIKKQIFSKHTSSPFVVGLDDDQVGREAQVGDGLAGQSVSHVAPALQSHLSVAGHDGDHQEGEDRARDQDMARLRERPRQETWQGLGTVGICSQYGSNSLQLPISCVFLVIGG